MFGTMDGGENQGAGRPEKSWALYLAGDIRVFQATEGSTDSSPVLFGVETVLWPKAAKKSGTWYLGIVDAADRFMAVLFGVETVLWPRAAKKSGTWYRGIVDAADRFKTRWHRGEAEKSSPRHAAEDAKSSDKGKSGGGAAVLIQLTTNEETK